MKIESASAASRLPIDARASLIVLAAQLQALQIFTGLRPEGANKWTGQIYNPEDGKTYDANVVLENATTLGFRAAYSSFAKRRLGGAKD
jgi:hypothetical protein